MTSAGPAAQFTREDSRFPLTSSNETLAPGVLSTARYEVQERTLGRGTEVVKVRFKVKRGAMVPVGLPGK